MYRPVRNPYAAPQASSSTCCCCFLSILVLVVFFVCLTPFLFSPEFAVKFPYLSSASIGDAEISAAFAEFTQTYEKAYESDEVAEYRRKVFEINYRKIQEYNQQSSKTCTLGVNKFADLTDEEFEKKHLSKPIQPNYREPKPKKYQEPNENVEINWVEKGKVAPVKDQGLCGSCWTFSAISVVETLVAIKDNKSPERYSEQQLVDCCITEDSHGCDGGEDSDAFDYLARKGIALDSQYPYLAIDDECKDTKVPMRVNITGHVDISSGNNTEMENAIQGRTLSVGLAAGPYVFRFYKKGVVTTGCPGDHITHAVTVVGAGTEDGIPYWLVRNSWGPNWGDKGYLKIARSPDGTTGVCGIACCAQYPLYNEHAK